MLHTSLKLNFFLAAFCLDCLHAYICMYYFTCLSFMFIFFLSACAPTVSCLYRALAAKFSLCHVNLFVN